MAAFLARLLGGVKAHNIQSVMPPRHAGPLWKMKRLFLLRHAKTEPHGPSFEDRARELLPRGRDDVPLVGRYMKSHGYRPDLILCSTATRTVQTLDLLQPLLTGHPETNYVDVLYLAEPDNLLAQIAAAPDNAKGLMLVGHNPGMEQLATDLSGAPVKRKVQDKMELMEEKFPTCALAVLDFNVKHWRDVEAKSGLLVDFVRPKDLR
jgi:phosphohistidine phosphatase